MKRSHWSNRDEFFSLVKKGGKDFIGQKEMESSHWSIRDGKFSLVNKGWKVFTGQ
jgi:hypothetical protein